MTGASLRRGRKDRRSRDYDFPTVGALYDRFGGKVPRDRMVSAVRDAITTFIPREGFSLEETRLKLVRKCEHSLRRMADGRETP